MGISAIRIEIGQNAQDKNFENLDVLDTASKGIYTTWALSPSGKLKACVRWLPVGVLVINDVNNSFFVLECLNSFLYELQYSNKSDHDRFWKVRIEVANTLSSLIYIGTGRSGPD